MRYRLQFFTPRDTIDIGSDAYDAVVDDLREIIALVERQEVVSA